MPGTRDLIKAKTVTNIYGNAFMHELHVMRLSPSTDTPLYTTHTHTHIDNLIYRVGSNRIPVQVPKKNSRSTSNASSQQYDIPKDRHNRTLYDIPHNNTPSIHESQNYSVVRPFSQSISTVHSVSGGQNIEAQNGHVVDTLLRSTATGDYIFMDNNEQLEEPGNEQDVQSQVIMHKSKNYIPCIIMAMMTVTCRVDKVAATTMKPTST